MGTNRFHGAPWPARNARSVTTLRREVKRFGCPNDDGLSSATAAVAEVAAGVAATLM